MINDKMDSKRLYMANAWEKIMLALEKNDFSEADILADNIQLSEYASPYFKIQYKQIRTKYFNVVWYKILDALKNYKFEEADRIVKKNKNLSDYFTEMEYEKLRFKYYSDSVKAKVLEALNTGKFLEADLIMKEKNAVACFLTEEKYRELRDQYVYKLVWTKIDEALKSYKFNLADDIVKRNPYLSEYFLNMKYQQLKIGYSNKCVWNKVIDALKNNNFLEADKIVVNNPSNRQYFDQMNFLQVKDDYLKEFLWNKISTALKNEEICEAEKIVNNHNQYEDFFLQKGYKGIRKKYEGSKIWKAILKELKEFNFIVADTLVKQHPDLRDIFDNNMYDQVREKQYKKYIWNKINDALSGYDFQTVDNLVNENPNFQPYFMENNYEQLKGTYIRQYFNDFFTDGDSPYFLDEHQSEAIASSSKNVLVNARAGSGKTRVIIANILYLIEKHNFSWNSLCVLAFNRNVPIEIAERIEKKVYLSNSPEKYKKLNIALTFHKLARDISGYKGKILADDKRRFIKLIIEDLKERNADFAMQVYELFREESFTVEKKRFKDPKEYYVYLRNKKYRTLKGNIVKSDGEKWIADFLFEYGIEYIYEKSYYISSIKDENLELTNEEKVRYKLFLKEGILETNEKKARNEIKPDFFLKDYDLVWEHWGIDENETSLERKKEFSKVFDSTWNQYKNNMIWKRKFWSPNWRKKIIESSNQAVSDIKRVNKLIETSISDMNCSREDFEKKLIQLLSSNNIPLSKRNLKELVEDVWDRSIDRFVDLMILFVNRFQQKFFDSKEKFVEQIDWYNNKPRVYGFLKLGIMVLHAYEMELQKIEKLKRFKEFDQYNIDFNQLITHAIGKIKDGENNEFISKLKVILIDEYQDFSELFLKLINTIIEKNPSIGLFCVGDDWQAINRFAGSDVKFFKNYSSYFPESNIKTISTNYRSCEVIVQASNDFMVQNGMTGQISLSKRKSNDSNDRNIQLSYVDDVLVDFYENGLNYKDDYIFISQYVTKEGKKEINYRLKVQYLKKCYEIIKENPNADVLLLHRNNEFKYSKLEQFHTKLVKVLVEKGIYKTKDECKKKINIKTMHSAKGLEAEIVILLEINQGIVPMIHPDNELYEIFGEDLLTNMEDQKRLFYVAITRAKEKLYILTERNQKSDFLNFLTIG